MEFPVVRLSDTQKEVIARIMSSPTPEVAWTETIKTPKLATARALLYKLGILVVDMMNKRVSLTKKGREIAEDEYIIDNSGSLTSDMSKVISK